MAIPARGQKVRGAPAPAPLTVAVEWGLAYEALIGLALFGGGESQASYEVGEGWFKRVRARASRELRESVRRLTRGDGHVVTGLAGLASAAGGRDVGALVDRIRADESGDVKRALLQHSHERALTDRDPREVALATADVLELWQREIFADLGPQLEPELEAAAGAIVRLQRHHAPERLIVRATRGVEYVREPWIRSVTLIPSVLNRPWVDITEWDGVKYFYYPAGPDEPTPAAQLVEVYKALGDETRLRILRHLSRGPTSLTDLADALGLAKSTVSQHMVVLRSAGLTRSLVGDEGKGYVLNERPDLNELLEDFLKG
jgi:DNA-binding transcriptional ArsR family regulator